MLYANGKYVNKNIALSNDWLLKAAKQGNSMAQFNIGRNYLNGDNGLPKNKAVALMWLKKAAKNGHAQAELLFDGLYP